MAIPGLKPKLDVRAKVRIGETRQSSKGRDYPAALDYFVSTDDEFNRLYDKPKVIRVVPAYDDPTEFFSTGLEWWIKDKNKKPLLACYTKDSGANPVALRMSGMLDAGQKPLSDQIVGNGKLKIACPARECPHFKKHGNKPPDCRPTARLTFFLEGGRTDAALQLDTKSWNTIEAIEGALGGYSSVRGKVFELSVAMVKNGADRYPVISIREVVEVRINDDADVEAADNLVALTLALEMGNARIGLAKYLDKTRPGWREDHALLTRLREIGPEEAARTILKRETA